MRYLFGDLTEFPFQENTLDLLSRFVDTAVEVLTLHHRCGELLDSIEEDRRFLDGALADVGELHETLRRAFGEVASSRPDEDVVSILVKGAADQVSRYLKDGKAKLSAKVEERIERTRLELDELNSEMLECLSRFFTRSGVPVNSQALRCQLQDGQYLAESDVLDMNGVRCGYKLDASGQDFFSTARRFGDLIAGKHDLPVDTRRAWLKKEPVIQTMRLDDATLTELLDDDETGEFRLARRVGNGGEGLRIRVIKGVSRKIEAYRIDPEGVQVSIPNDLMQPGHIELLLQFWDSVYHHVPGLHAARVGLKQLTVGGEDVIASRRAPEVVRRMVDYLAPTVREIDVRSPAVEELCLKVERDGGRREEIYVPKARLAARLAELPEGMRDLFEPLGITLSDAVISEEVLDDESGEAEGVQIVEQPPSQSRTVDSSAVPIVDEETATEAPDAFDAAELEEVAFGPDDEDDIEIDVDESALEAMGGDDSSDDPEEERGG